MTAGYPGSYYRAMNSLRRLRTDYIDLYQIHRFDPETTCEETLEALHDVVKSGKVRYIGASSMYAWQFAHMLHFSRKTWMDPLCLDANHYNLIYREEEHEMLPLCRAEGIGVIPWSPIAHGFLAGNRLREGSGKTIRAKTDDFAQSMYFQDSDFEIVDRVFEIAQQHNLKPAQVALAWLVQKEGITAPIIGASKMHHIDEAVEALKVEFSDQEMVYLEEHYQPHPILGHT